MRYANVRRLETWLKGPKGLDRDKLRDEGPSEEGGETEAESLRRDSYWDSKEFSIFRYNFLSEPAAFVV